MAQAPTSNTPAPSSGGGKGGGGSGKTSGSSSKGSRSSSKGGGKGKVSAAGKSPVLGNANNMPAHFAKQGMSGTYDTKGKFASWSDGQEAFKG